MPQLSSSEVSPLLPSPNYISIDNDKEGATGLKGNTTQHENNTAHHKASSFSNEDEHQDIGRATVFSLAVVTFVQAYLLEGVFPYAGFLTLHLLSEKEELAVNEETVGRYAGFIACSFMVGRTVSAVFWGRMADAYGRKVVLEVCLVASAITSVGFGFATTYWEALLWRFLMGVGNGITGTIKCLLSEIKASSGSQSRETKTVAIIYGMRGYGFLICPAITGYLSDPVTQYPDTMATYPTWIQSMLKIYPFVSPNLLACVLCILACALVTKHVDETLPKETCRPLQFRAMNMWKRGKLGKESQRIDISVGVEKEGQGGSIRGKKHGLSTTHQVTAKELLWYSSERSEYCQQQREKVRRRWYHLYVYWMCSFLNIASDELFPLFCLSNLSGLGLVEKQIAFLLGASTIAYGLLQYLLLTGLVDRIGLYPTLRLAIVCGVPLGILIPLGSLCLNTEDGNSYEDEPRTKLKLWLVIYLCSLIATIKSFASVVFSTLVMAMNRTVDTIDQRATLNGIVSLGGSFAQACGPIFSGVLFSFLAGSATNNIDSIAPTNPIIKPPFGSIVAYGIMSVLALLLGVQTLAMPET